MTIKPPDDLSLEELEQITELVYQLYRYDFREYAKASLKRRLLRIMSRFQMDLEGFMLSLKTRPTFIHQFISELTVNVTEMFRDPFVFQALFNQVIPELAKLDKIRIWHAGCSTGEEALSMAIMLHHAGMLERAEILGTDLNPIVLQQAKKGAIPVKQMETNSQNYQEVFPEHKLNTFFETQFDTAFAKPEILRHINYRTHDLVTDEPPGQFDLVVCRNVYIYFEIGLQDQVLKLLYNSIQPEGFMCLGSKETIRFTTMASKFEVLNQEARIFKRHA